MAHTLGLRATSFAMSAAVLGLAVVGALSVSITLSRATSGPDVITTIIERPEDPPKPPPTLRERRPQTVVDDPVATEQPVSDPSPQPPTEFLGPVVQSVGPQEITNPRWLRRPRDLAAYYPRRAMERGVMGEVVLDCLVSPVGRLACNVVSETPSNWGFAEAALRISRDHLMAPATRDGMSIEGRYRMRVPFQVE